MTKLLKLRKKLKELKVDSVIDAMTKYSDGLEVEFFCTHRAKILAGDKELM